MAELRIGDAQREQAATRLSDEVGTGRLTLGEYEQRVGRVYAAHTASELAAVFADLPPAARTAPPGNGSSRTARSWPAPVAAMWAPWVAASVISMVVWVATSLGAGHALYFWPIWVAGPWGVMLLVGTLTGRGMCTKPLPR
jgi:hypothetical protein